MASRFARLGNDLYTGKRSYNIIGRRRTWFVVAISLVALSLLLLLVRGLNLGVEFTGGSAFTVSGASTTSSEPAQAALNDVAPGQVARVSVAGGDTVQIRTEQLDAADTDEMADGLAEGYGVDASEVTSTFVGPQWGSDVSTKALQGLVTFLAIVSVVMALYFRTWTMSVAAIVALLHDVVITVGVYAAIGFEVTPASVIGFLTILGYSLYDTVVVFDKVRENTAHILEQNRITYAEGANLAVNQTIVRSINTSIVGVLPVASILFVGVFLLGAGTLRDIALALFVGMIVSTWSSIMLASPLETALRLRRPAYAEHTAKVLAQRVKDEAGDVAVTSGDVRTDRVITTIPGGHLGQDAQPKRRKRTR